MSDNLEKPTEESGSLSLDEWALSTRDKAEAFLRDREYREPKAALLRVIAEAAESLVSVWE